MFRIIKNIPGRADLCNAPGIHDGHAVRDMGDGPQIVGYKDDSDTGLIPDLDQKVKDLGFHSHIKSGSGLVCKQDLRIGG